MPSSRSQFKSTRMRVVLIDDWPTIRDLWRMECELRLKGVCEVVGEAGDGNEAVALILQSAPDCVVLDLKMPGMSGFEVIDAVRQRSPTVRFLVASSHCTPWAVSLIRKLGVAGFVDKPSEQSNALTQALTAIADGRTHFSPRFERVAHDLRGGRCPIAQVLSEREGELLALIVEALSDAEIGTKLGIAATTAKTHRGRIMRKLGMPNCTKLIQFAHEVGFAAFPPRTRYADRG